MQSLSQAVQLLKLYRRRNVGQMLDDAMCQPVDKPVVDAFLAILPDNCKTQTMKHARHLTVERFIIRCLRQRTLDAICQRVAQESAA